MSAVSGDGVDAVRARLGNRTGVLLGSSGVGKSTLLNRLIGAAAQVTQGVSDAQDRGRHTTTRRELFVLPGGGVVIDTPGMRELAAWADGQTEAPPDPTLALLEALAGRCKFADCAHGDEPGCAVRAAIEAGTLSTERVAHARQLAAERAASAQRQDVFTRRESTRQSKVAQRAYRDSQRRKGRGE